MNMFYSRNLILPLNKLLTRATSQCAQLSCYGNGLGKYYKWMPGLEEGLKCAKDTQKPLMLVIHTSWCCACKALGPKFSKSKELIRLSDNFVMVNLLDCEPKGKNFAPDGMYIPRILFLTPAGVVRKDIVNEGVSNEDDFKYYYANTTDIAKSMRKAIKLMCSPSLKCCEDI